MTEEDIYLVINERRHNIDIVKITHSEDDAFTKADRLNKPSLYNEGINWVIKARILTRTENND